MLFWLLVIGARTRVLSAFDVVTLALIALGYLVRDFVREVRR